ncbi:dedicator of cytokinesis protein 5-like [Malurus melanocephalus]|uniref:dedicator of cytokinesis protein 5-like n=1 Tax=Malurus melanocephalus TaxID=175006 RepID=UPI0025476A12|nr:dedicator of cytokinesis protein 5-like [Malurus melanocephalus]
MFFLHFPWVTLFFLPFSPQVAIAIEEVSRCHLRFTFRHRSSQESRDRSERAFGVAFVKLMNADGTTLRDGKHNLIVYKGDNKRMEEARSYLSLPCTKAELEEREKEAPVARNLPGLATFGPGKDSGRDSSRDSFQIATAICSTKLTQNGWEGEFPSPTLDLLLSPQFLPDTLDALFNIMMEMSENETFDFLVFDALNEDGNEFNDAIRRLFLSFNVLMDRPLEEAVKIKVSSRKIPIFPWMGWEGDGAGEGMRELFRNSFSSAVPAL